MLRRRGLSLLEVILALAILALSMAAIGELVRIGNHNAREVQLLTRAQIHCESKLSELVCGVIVPAPVTRLPIPTDPEWFYSVHIAPTDEPGVVAAAVTVETDIHLPRPVGFTLVRWMPDPGIEFPDEPLEPAYTDPAMAGGGVDDFAGGGVGGGGFEDASGGDGPDSRRGGGRRGAGGENNIGRGGGPPGGGRGAAGGGRGGGFRPPVPGNLPRELPGNLPRDLPGNLPRDLPRNLPGGIPSDILDRIR